MQTPISSPTTSKRGFPVSRSRSARMADRSWTSSRRARRRRRARTRGGRAAQAACAARARATAAATAASSSIGRVSISAPDAGSWTESASGTRGSLMPIAMESSARDDIRGRFRASSRKRTTFMSCQCKNRRGRVRTTTIAWTEDITMSRLAAVLAFPLAFALAPAAHAEETLAQVQAIARCQKAIAREGAKYAQRIIKSTLKCTEETNECQVQCELGVFGPFCDTDPGPGCCDPDDPGSNPTFGACMADAQLTCDREAAKRVNYETQKQSAIIAACSALTTDELCGAQTVGLNF